jgi:AraC-like DNA-binding protein/mannose-6-phosphate isomerase-like protein (cupin superfamily)
MSPARQPRRLTPADEPYLAARTYSAVFSSGLEGPEHAHPWRQLLYAAAGAMTVRAGASTWLIPPGKAVDIPAGCRHSMRMWGAVDMLTLYLRDGAPDAETCRVLSVTPLLRELILRVVDWGMLDSRDPEHLRLLAVLLDEIARAPETPLLLPMPADPRAAAIARHVLANPAEPAPLDALARRFGAGRRTAERLFRGQTGISFGLWQQKARMLTAVRLLAEGCSVTVVRSHQHSAISNQPLHAARRAQSRRRRRQAEC